MRITDAVSAFRAAGELFERTNQPKFAVNLHHHLADVLRTLGETQQSWEEMGRHWLVSRQSGSRPVAISFYNASLFASSQGLLEAALLFQNATIGEALRTSVTATVDAFTQRAVIHARRNELADARSDLEQANARLPEVTAGALKAYLKAEIDVLTPQLSQQTGTGAAEAFQRAIAFFDSAQARQYHGYSSGSPEPTYRTPSR